MYEFKTNGPIVADIEVARGGISVTADDVDGVTVDVTPDDGSGASRAAAENTRVDLDGDTLVVETPDRSPTSWRRGGAVRVVARVPLDSRLRLKVASADAEVRGRWQEASIRSASGDINVEEVTGDAEVNTASGDVRIGRVGGALQGHSASGDLSVGALGGDASLHSASGDIDVQDSGGSVQVRTASGDIDVHRARRGVVRAQTASGDVTVAVEPGTRVYLDVSTVSGSTRSDLDHTAPLADNGADLTIAVRTVSGDFTVLRAAQTARA
jgi:hypothetical protein